MSVTNQQSKVSYAASGNDTYPIPFLFTENEHIKLFVDDVALEYGVDYSVDGAGVEEGGELTFISEPPETGSVVILREIPLTQDASLNDGGPNAAATTESFWDKTILIFQQLNEKISRAIKMPVSSDLNPQMTGAVVPNAMLVVDEEGEALKMGPSYVAFSTDMDTKVSQAQTYANNAQSSAEAAATSASESEDSNAASALSAQEAAISEANAAASEAAAAASAATAQQAADSVLFNDVIFITAGMSPLILTSAHNGSMLACDTSLGPISLTLPLIADLDLDVPFTVSVKKTDSSGNSVTINRAGTNLIDEGTQKVLGSAGAGATFIPDADPNPDVWTSAEFGATAGNLSNDVFSGNGSQTAFTLSVAPGSKNNTQVFIEGVYQKKSSYSVSGTTLTFTEAPIAGTSNIEVNTGTTLAVGTPADSTVTLAKLAADVLAALVPVGTPLWNISSDPIPGFISAMNKTIGNAGADYTGSQYQALYTKIWNMAGLSITAGDPFRIASAKGASALADWSAGKLITVDFLTNEVFIRTKGASRNEGSYQADDLKSHTHVINGYNAGLSMSGGGNPVMTASNGQVSGATGGTETRPKNTALFAFIKY